VSDLSHVGSLGVATVVKNATDNSRLFTCEHTRVCVCVCVQIVSGKNLNLP